MKEAHSKVVLFTMATAFLTTVSAWGALAPPRQTQDSQIPQMADGVAGEAPGEKAQKIVEPTMGTTPGSLWPGFVPFVDWTSDVRARRVGDLVTIRVIENVSATQTAETDTSHDASMTAGIDHLFGLQNHVPSSIDLANLIGGSSSSAFKGGGSNNRSNRLTATITATVVEVMPNGNLVLRASRYIKVNQEEEQLLLQGIVRPYDVGPRNEVLSTALANVEIRYGGKGVIGSNLKPGLLFRIIHILF